MISEASLPVWRQTFWTCLTVTRDSVVLPLPSFSLKVVEDYVGFERKEAEYGGAWAMAIHRGNGNQRRGKAKELMDKILAYNKEDLEATGRCSSGEKVWTVILLPCRLAWAVCPLDPTSICRTTSISVLLSTFPCSIFRISDCPFSSVRGKYHPHVLTYHLRLPFAALL